MSRLFPLFTLSSVFAKIYIYNVCKTIIYLWQENPYSITRVYKLVRTMISNHDTHQENQWYKDEMPLWDETLEFKLGFKVVSD